MSSGELTRVEMRDKIFNHFNHIETALSLSHSRSKPLIDYKSGERERERLPQRNENVTHNSRRRELTWMSYCVFLTAPMPPRVSGGGV